MAVFVNQREELGLKSLEGSRRTKRGCAIRVGIALGQNDGGGYYLKDVVRFACAAKLVDVLLLADERRLAKLDLRRLPRILTLILIRPPCICRLCQIPHHASQTHSSHAYLLRYHVCQSIVDVLELIHNFLEQTLNIVP